MLYNVIIPKSVIKIFDELDDGEKSKIITKLQILEENPNPFGAIKLKGYKNQYRLRVGSFRIRYYINKEKFEVVILDLAHRKDAYKKK